MKLKGVIRMLSKQCQALKLGIITIISDNATYLSVSTGPVPVLEVRCDTMILYASKLILIAEDDFSSIREYKNTKTVKCQNQNYDRDIRRAGVVILVHSPKLTEILCAKQIVINDNGLLSTLQNSYSVVNYEFSTLKDLTSRMRSHKLGTSLGIL
jgi:hypothetical protein